MDNNLSVAIHAALSFSSDLIAAAFVKWKRQMITAVMSVHKRLREPLARVDIVGIKRSRALRGR
jgi:hypothetical protein